MTAYPSSLLYSIPLDGNRVLIESGGENQTNALLVNRVIQNTKNKIVYAHPVRNVSYHTLRMNPMPEADLHQAIEFKLKNTGLIPNSGQTIWSYCTRMRNDSQSCIFARRLHDENPPGEYPSGDLLFTSTADLYESPPNSILFWIEEGSWVYAIRGEDEIAYAQSLSSKVINEESWRMIETIMAVLIAEKICNPINQFIFPENTNSFTYSAPEFCDNYELLFYKTLTIKQEIDDKRLIPQVVTDKKLYEQKKLLLKRVLTGILLIYLSFAAVLASKFIILKIQNHRMQNELALHSNEVNAIKDISRFWNQRSWLLDPSLSPLEILLSLKSSLPSDHIRFITFQYNPSSINIVGEGKTAAAVYEFAERIRLNHDLSHIKWEIPPPRLSANGSAIFQMEGVKK